MSIRSEAAEVIRRAEETLRGLLARAADSAQYDDLQVLAGWAKSLKTLVDESDVPVLLLAPQPGHGTLSSAVRGREVDIRHPAEALSEPANAGGSGGLNSPPAEEDVRGGSEGPMRAARHGRRSPPAPLRHRGRSRKNEYPKFLREGQSLVKIGWSKSDKKPYEHRAPKRVLDVLVAALLELGQGGRRFTTDELLPLRDGKDDIPSYQAYLTLAWLRAEHLVRQHGRQGYSLPAGIDFAH
jgi:hypothetical protein